MKFWFSSLLLGLLVVLHLQSCVEGHYGTGVGTCCFSYCQKPIPAGYIVNYEETHSGCSKPGLIFITQKGKRVCVDPDQDWVQQIRGKLDWKPVDNSN